MVAQTAKSLPAMQEIWVQSLSQENPLEKGMANHSSILGWKIPWTKEPSKLQSMGSQTKWRRLFEHIHTLCQINYIPITYY